LIAAQVMFGLAEPRVILLQNDGVAIVSEMTSQVCNAGDPSLLPARAYKKHFHRLQSLSVHGTAALVACVADDETANPGWLFALIETMQAAARPQASAPTRFIEAPCRCGGEQDCSSHPAQYRQNGVQPFGPGVG
jgi:hypothetical protein